MRAMTEGAHRERAALAHAVELEFEFEATTNEMKA